MKTMNQAVAVLRNFKLYSAISIFGLALSLGAAILLTRYLHQELIVNHYIPEHGNCYVLTMQNTVNGQTNRMRLISNRNMNNDKNFIDPLDNPNVELVGKFKPAYDPSLVETKPAEGAEKQTFSMRAAAALHGCVEGRTKNTCGRSHEAYGHFAPKQAFPTAAQRWTAAACSHSARLSFQSQANPCR